MRTILAIVVWLASSAASAHVHTGRVEQLRVDGVGGGPLCVTTAPALPAVAYACLHTSWPHYQEMRELVLRAFESGAACRLEWNQVDSLTNRARIEAISCFRPER